MDVSRAAIAAVPWALQGATAIPARIVYAVWTLSAARPCGIPPAPRKRFSTARINAIVPMDWGTVPGIVASPTGHSGARRVPVSCAFVKSIPSAVPMCGMQTAWNGLPLSALIAVDAIRSSPMRVVKRDLSPNRVQAVKSPRRSGHWMRRVRRVCVRLPRIVAMRSSTPDGIRAVWTWRNTTVTSEEGWRDVDLSAVVRFRLLKGAEARASNLRAPVAKGLRQIHPAAMIRSVWNVCATWMRRAVTSPGIICVPTKRITTAQVPVLAAADQLPSSSRRG